MKLAIAAGLPLLVGACSALPELDTAPGLTAAAKTTPATMAQPGPAVAYMGYRVQEPADWRSLNDAQREGGE
ncbi:hypothetical protein ANTHELSMS3_05077 (plasmid) [Antarctobacter heliothermus]|uniref:Lipoprotein n=1 Tax=Antarctobacter heliothermus TaxID=74033 RepID=A0A222EB88_9RHOB|nr:hypothetical protein [Antarctobacter heliothermus]ASP23457.1 hypothetical protein ANTHELSMS3_05077 [Antarctobacter heliothermus]MBT56250.1 hypothetical protein [Mameliella sp.]|tara:strand:- start:629 stop:844 length:216 start_codon:yes stop_codon:yes gene_type:complete